MQINAISTILFRGDAKPQIASEVKPNADTKAAAQDKPELKQPPKQDTVEIKKAEPKCEGDACKCTGDNCKK